MQKQKLAELKAAKLSFAYDQRREAVRNRINNKQ
jgi:hypothetical protein